MAVELGLAIRGDLAAHDRAEARAMAKIHTQIVRRAASRTAKGIQAQIRAGFDNRGKRFVKAIRWKSDPRRGVSAETVATVSSKARYKATHGVRREAFNLLDLYREPGTVLAASKKWLAIPTENAPRAASGKRQATPRESGLKLRFVPLTSFRAVLVLDRQGRGKGEKGVVMYVLVRQTLRRRRVDPDAADRASVARSDADFAQLWAREDAALRARYGVGLRVAA